MDIHLTRTQYDLTLQYPFVGVYFAEPACLYLMTGDDPDGENCEGFVNGMVPVNHHPELPVRVAPVKVAPTAEFWRENRWVEVAETPGAPPLGRAEPALHIGIDLASGMDRLVRIVLVPPSDGEGNGRWRLVASIAPDNEEQAVAAHKNLASMFLEAGIDGDVDLDVETC